MYKVTLEKLKKIKRKRKHPKEVVEHDKEH